MNEVWATLNIEDSLLSGPVRSNLHSDGMISCVFRVCVKECSLTA